MKKHRIRTTSSTQIKLQVNLIECQELILCHKLDIPKHELCNQLNDLYKSYKINTTTDKYLTKPHESSDFYSDVQEFTRNLSNLLNNVASHHEIITLLNNGKIAHEELKETLNTLDKLSYSALFSSRELPATKKGRNNEKENTDYLMTGLRTLIRQTSNSKRPRISYFIFDCFELFSIYSSGQLKNK